MLPDPGLVVPHQHLGHRPDPGQQLPRPGQQVPGHPCGQHQRHHEPRVRRDHRQHRRGDHRPGAVGDDLQREPQVALHDLPGPGPGPGPGRIRRPVGWVRSSKRRPDQRDPGPPHRRRSTPPDPLGDHRGRQVGEPPQQAPPIAGSNTSTADPAGRRHLGGSSAANAAHTVFRSTPSRRAIMVIPNPSLRCSSRISTQSSTVITPSLVSEGGQHSPSVSQGVSRHAASSDRGDGRMYRSQESGHRSAAQPHYGVRWVLRAEPELLNNRHCDRLTPISADEADVYSEATWWSDQRVVTADRIPTAPPPLPPSSMAAPPPGSQPPSPGSSPSYARRDGPVRTWPTLSAPEHRTARPRPSKRRARAPPRHRWAAATFTSCITRSTLDTGRFRPRPASRLHFAGMGATGRSRDDAGVLRLRARTGPHRRSAR